MSNKGKQNRSQSRPTITLATPDTEGAGQQLISWVQDAFAKTARGFVWAVAGEPSQPQVFFTADTTRLPSHQAAMIPEFLGMAPADPQAAMAMLTMPVEEFAQMAASMLPQREAELLRQKPMALGWCSTDGSVYGWMIVPEERTILAPSEAVVSRWGIPT